MDNIGLALVIGISSSLFATALFITLSEFVRRVVFPWYEDKIYRGVRIDGNWKLVEVDGLDLNDLEDTAKLVLKQKGDRVTGSYSHLDEETNLVDEYILEGKIRDMYFLATAIPKSTKNIDGISFLLHVDNVKSILVLCGAILSKSNPGEVQCFEGTKFCWMNS